MLTQTFEAGREDWHQVCLAHVYGLPAITGKIGRPDTPVVGFAGDGAFGISMAEMSAVVNGFGLITMVIFRTQGAVKYNTVVRR